MNKRKATLASGILSRVKPVKRNVAWWEQLPEDLLQEANNLREQFQAGRLVGVNKTRLASAIVEEFESRGHGMPKVGAVVEWLNAKPPKT